MNDGEELSRKAGSKGTI
uniref:Uncharacterized protein n=1 Tax=Lepeophtheirus salmonis TaxID=72036 RepID=A0A0K2TIP9_LEPSM